MHTRLSFHVYMAETGERLTRACNTLIYMTLSAGECSSLLSSPLDYAPGVGTATTTTICRRFNSPFI